jgi:hypothetical protein
VAFIGHKCSARHRVCARLARRMISNIELGTDEPFLDHVLAGDGFSPASDTRQCTRVS